jgi:hypothetical protein
LSISSGRQWGGEVRPDSDIFEDLGCVADDFDEMLEVFIERYSVDMTAYLWYFHNQAEEGMPSLMKRPYDEVERIPITPVTLAGFASRGKWEMDYPEHPPFKRGIAIGRSMGCMGWIILIVIVAALPLAIKILMSLQNNTCY